MAFISTLQIMHEDEVSVISFEAVSSLLRLTWRQHPTSAEYRRGYEQALKVALENKVKNWLTDSRKVAYLHLADQHWMYSKMIPLLIEGELHKFALVLQPEVFMMTDRKPIQNYAEENAAKESLDNLEFFLDLASAQYWLLQGNQGIES